MMDSQVGLEGVHRGRWKDTNWDSVFDGDIVSNHYFMRSGLIRKDLLGKYSSYYPETVLVDDYQSLVNFFCDPSELSDTAWVLKYPASSNGVGIEFFRQPTEVYHAFHDKQGRVIQRCINPVLHHGRKFHIRVSVLAVGKLDVYVGDECRVLVATSPFNWDDLHKRDVHITNRSANIDHPDYSPNRQNVALSELEYGVDVLEQIRECVRSLFKQLESNPRHFFAMRNCFELFGLDFMLGAGGGDGDGGNGDAGIPDSSGKYRLWLLEANPDPNVEMFGVDDATQLVGENPLHTIPAGFTKVYSR